MGRSTAAMISLLIGGVFVLLGALVFFSAIARTVGTGLVLGSVGIASGILMAASGVMAYVKPAHAHLWGIVGLVFSITSLVIAGGFIIGFFLGLIGGMLALVYKEKTEKPARGKRAAKPVYNDNVSAWWILAGLFLIGMLAAPSRISNTSSRHKGMSWIFVLTFVIGLFAIVSSYNNHQIGWLISLVIDIAIMLVFVVGYDRSDKPFSTLATYVLIGLIITIILGFLISLATV